MSAEREVIAAHHAPDLQRLCRYMSELSPQPMVAVEGVTHVVSYLNPAFARLVGRHRKDLIGRPFAEAVPEEVGNGCLALLNRVFRTGAPENLAEQEHRQTGTQPVYWSYAMWAILGADDHPAGVMVQVTDSTEIARFRHQVVAMNESLILSSVQQHELVAQAESLNALLREAHDRLEERVVERTAELGTANALLRDEIGARRAAEADRQDLLRRLATAQENERRRIARDLHDQMAQHLTALSLNLKSLELSAPDLSPARPQLAKLQELTAQIGRDVHQLATELRPTGLDDLGLESALANYAEKWSERSGAAVDFQATGTGSSRLPEAVETALYRVVQEALTNVIKHARAGRVSVVLQCSRNDAVVVVEDDGTGFDSESDIGPGADGGQLGVRGMRERLALIGGTLTIESTLGRGTTVIARIPLTADGREG